MKGLLTLTEHQCACNPKPTVTVEIWHVDRFSTNALDPRTRVYGCLALAGLIDELILELAWREFNVGDDPSFGTPSAAALEYRDALRDEQSGYGTRSLSVGDEIRVDGRRYICQSFGWARTTETPIEVPVSRG